MGAWDSHNNPALELPQFGLRVEYDVDFPRDENEVSGHMIYLLIRTGALRFRGADRAPQRLEIGAAGGIQRGHARLDLFTGVAGIGADPAWGFTVPVPVQRVLVRRLRLAN